MERVFPLFVDNRLIFEGMFVSPEITTVAISRELDPKLLFRNSYIQNGTVLAKYAHCFAILMRLRQLCLHPKLCEEECQSLQRAQDLLQGIYNWSYMWNDIFWKHDICFVWWSYLRGCWEIFFNICHVAVTEKRKFSNQFSNRASYHLRSGGNRLLLKLCHRKSVSS